MDDYENMTLEELEEAYVEVLRKLHANDKTMAESAAELAKLSDPEARGDSLLAQSAIRWGRVASLLDKIEELMEQNNTYVEDLNTINWYYDQQSGQG